MNLSSQRWQHIVQIDILTQHIRDRNYMDGVARDRLRKLHTSEFFTPTQMVQEILDQYDQQQFEDPHSIWCDNSCGDGQFLGEVLIRKIATGIDFETALGTIYGVDIMQDNVDLCRERLLCGRQDLRHIVERNIVCADSLEYGYRFGEPELFGNGMFEMPT